MRLIDGAMGIPDQMTSALKRNIGNPDSGARSALFCFQQPTRQLHLDILLGHSPAIGSVEAKHGYLYSWSSVSGSDSLGNPLISVPIKPASHYAISPLAISMNCCSTHSQVADTRPQSSNLVQSKVLKYSGTLLTTCSFRQQNGGS